MQRLSKMSQASKHVEWCLRKAEKEIEDCKKDGKRPKHRGLLKINPNVEEAKEHVKKAEHNLDAALNFVKTGFSDWSASAFFYSMYHCFLAIAAKFGYESSNQTCTIALIEYLKEEGKINIDEEFIEMFKYKENETEKEESAIEIREDYTYSAKISVNKEKINDLTQKCRNLIDTTRKIVFD